MNYLEYSVRIPPERADITEAAICAHLRDNPHDDVDDALEAIFSLGVNVHRSLEGIGHGQIPEPEETHL